MSRAHKRETPRGEAAAISSGAAGAGPSLDEARVTPQRSALSPARGPVVAQLLSPPPAVTIVQRQEIHEPRPLLATEKNCEGVIGLEPRAFRRALRLLALPTITTPDGVAVVVADLEGALRERGRPLESEPPRKRRDRKPANDTLHPDDAERAELESFGLRRGASR